MVTVCHTRVLTTLQCREYFDVKQISKKNELTNCGFWGKSFENSSHLRLFAAKILYVVHLDNKKSHKGGFTGTPGPPPPSTPLLNGLIDVKKELETTSVFLCNCVYSRVVV